MLLRIIHIVNSLSKVNFGIYNAALFTSSYLFEKYNHASVLWVAGTAVSDPVKLSIPVIYLGESVSDEQLFSLLKGISCDSTVFVSHGCWRLPTRLGARLKVMGFKWIYAPHGMLEPWSMQQKKWKKWIYFNLIERRYAMRADAVRAVSAAEKNNLEKTFTREVVLVENGIQIPDITAKNNEERFFLFMARLHHKKGILPLVKAWTSAMKGTSKVKLIIAGPDEGELKKIQPYFDQSISYIGAVYGQEKETILRKAHYFILPSFSEGFPTSVVEAMGFGLIPVISKECNFPQVFEHALGYEVIPEESNIEGVLRNIRKRSFDNALSERNHFYIQQHNSEPVLAEKLLTLYTGLLAK